MDAVSLFLIATAAVLLLGALGEVLFQRTGVPQPLWLIVCGLLLGPVFGLVPREDVAQLAPFVALPALVIVIAELGLQSQVGSVMRSIARVAPLSLISFATSVTLVTLVVLFAQLLHLMPESWDFTHSLLLGCILGPPCSLITVPAMRRSRLDANTARALELEVSLSGILAVLTVALITGALAPQASGLLDSALHLIANLAFGLGFGLVGGIMWCAFLYALQAPSYAYPSTLGALFVLYVVVGQADGSTILAVLIFTILLANAPALSKKLGLSRVVEVPQNAGGRRELLLAMRSTFFLFVGLLLGPPWTLVGIGVLLALLLLPARIPAVLASIKLDLWHNSERPWMVLSMPRGMLAAALALLPLQLGIEETAALPMIVFTTVSIAIAAYAIGFPYAKKNLGASPIVQLEVNPPKIGAGPVSRVTPDEASKQALMPSSMDDAVTLTSASQPNLSGSSETIGPMSPPKTSLPKPSPPKPDA